MGRRVALALVLLLVFPAVSEAGAFTSCASLVGYAQRHFADTRGVPSRPVMPAGGPVPNAQPAEGGAAPTSAAAPSFSTTNVQEEGVDEPDLVKTNGRTVFALSGTRLNAVDVSGAPRLAGSLDLGPQGAGGQL